MFTCLIYVTLIILIYCYITYIVNINIKYVYKHHIYMHYINMIPCHQLRQGCRENRKQEKKKKTDSEQPVDLRFQIPVHIIKTESQGPIDFTCRKTQKGRDQIQGLQPSNHPSVTVIYTQGLSWLVDTTQTGCVTSDNLRR